MGKIFFRFFTKEERGSGAGKEIEIRHTSNIFFHSRVVIPLCGGNIDTTILGRCLERGLAADGRLVKFTVTVSDRPGGIAELAKVLTTAGVSIKDMVHERAWIKNDIFSVEVYLDFDGSVLCSC